MKKLAYLVIAVLLVAFGWFIRGRMADREMVNIAYGQVAFSQKIIEQLACAQTDDAILTLRSHQDRYIEELDNGFDPIAISSEEMNALRELQTSIQSSHEFGSNEADPVLAKVARYRATHPWTYKGNLPHSTNTAVETKLASMLKRDSESQKP